MRGSRSFNASPSSPCSCYGAVLSLSGDAEQGVSVEAVGQGECSLYSEDTVTDEEGPLQTARAAGEPQTVTALFTHGVLWVKGQRNMTFNPERTRSRPLCTGG